MSIYTTCRYCGKRIILRPYFANDGIKYMEILDDDESGTEHDCKNDKIARLEY